MGTDKTRQVHHFKIPTSHRRIQLDPGRPTEASRRPGTRLVSPAEIQRRRAAAKRARRTRVRQRRQARK